MSQNLPSKDETQFIFSVVAFRLHATLEQGCSKPSAETTNNADVIKSEEVKRVSIYRSV